MKLDGKKASNACGEALLPANDESAARNVL